MPGYKVDKYANLRAAYAYMLGHSGKKLLFMGQEFAQEREWSEERELDWYLLEQDLNRGMKDYVGELLKIYRKYPAMYTIDNSWDGFEWLNADDKERSVYSFYRKDGTGKNRVLFVLNMTPIKREDYWVPVPVLKNYKLVMNSDEKRFGGGGLEIPAQIKAIKGECVGKPYYISFDLPAYGAAIFTF